MRRRRHLSGYRIVLIRQCSESGDDLLPKIFTSTNNFIADAGLFGGGSFPQPGEISLAQNGVLFLDELPEFKRSVMEVLRQPMEERVIRARKLQEERFKGLHGIHCNAQIPSKRLHSICHVNEEGQALLKDAMERINLSARAYNRILKVARTIADLDGSENIRTEHLAEAIQYRSLDRENWGS